VSVLLYRVGGFSPAMAKKMREEHMTSGDSKFQAVANFNSLRWKKARVIVGDGPDARTCTFLFEARIRRCLPSWDLIRFANGKTFWIPSRTLEGKPAFLFLYWPLHELWRRRELERRLLQWLEVAAVDEALVVAEWVLERAGVRESLWPSRPYLVAVVGDHLPNVGVLDLELLVSVIGSKAGEPSRAAA
jgi:hypothetical protein